MPAIIGDRGSNTGAPFWNYMKTLHGISEPIARDKTVRFTLRLEDGPVEVVMDPTDFEDMKIAIRNFSDKVNMHGWQRVSQT